MNPVTSAKDLGTTFDSILSYNERISNLTSSCIRKLCQINRVKDSSDVKTLQSIVEMLVINKLSYGSTIWSNTSAKNIKELQTVQNFAARIITKVRKFDHITPSLQELNCYTYTLLKHSSQTIVRSSTMTLLCHIIRHVLKPETTGTEPQERNLRNETTGTTGTRIGNDRNHRNQNETRPEQSSRTRPER